MIIPSTAISINKSRKERALLNLICALWASDALDEAFRKHDTIFL